MTRICVALSESTTAGMVDRMVDLDPLADMFEIRADLVSDLDPLVILRARTKPLLFTCSPVCEGGRCPDDDPNRRTLLLEATKHGFDYVDVNYRSSLLDVMVEKAGHGLVVSYHDLEGVPEDLRELYDRMSDRGADIVKMAVTPHSIRDVGRLMAFARLVKEEGGPPLVAIAMGPLGTLTRILGGRVDAPFTFASATSGAETAPGQIPVKLMAELYRVREINAETRVYGILGQGVGKSLSPTIHNTGFKERGLNAVYVPLEAEALLPFILALPDLGLSGFSVTRPYKVDIMGHLSMIDEGATDCGSVNTVVVNRDGTLQGSTTDGTGVTVPIRERRTLRGAKVAILGAGGAARSAALALKKQGARVTLMARNPAKAAAVAHELDASSDALANLAKHKYDVLINATPVGTGDPEVTPVPTELLRANAVLLDMVYVPVETRLIREGRAAHCRVINGVEMLLAQAVGQFETWTGAEAPVAAMRTALYAAVERPE
jgi:3-dehydroquinate dehydratase / shikimate dehydrogenase